MNKKIGVAVGVLAVLIVVIGIASMSSVNNANVQTQSANIIGGATRVSQVFAGQCVYESRSWLFGPWHVDLIEHANAAGQCTATIIK